MDNFEFEPDEVGDEEGGEGGDWVFGGRNGTIFLVDVSMEMFQTRPEEDAESDEKTLFKRAIKCANSTAMRKIISNDQDLSAVVFFNSRSSKNSSDFPNIFVLQDLDRPGAERVLQLEALLEDDGRKFERDYGHSATASLQDVLWLSQNMFSSCKHKLLGKSIMVFTCCDSPHSGDAQKQMQARLKVRDLKEADIDLEVLPMGNNFDPSKFYKDLLMDQDGTTRSSGILANPTTRFEELLERVRRLDHKQRTCGRVGFALAPGLEMCVSLYTSIRKTSKPSKLKLWRRTNEEVKYMKKEFLAETGELLMPSDYAKYQEYGGKRIKFTLDEVRCLNKVYEPGIELLGFKPIESIKPYFYIRPSNFMYPDDKNMPGSAKLFSALLERCQSRRVAAIVRLIPRKGASVSWAALLPQLEELDDSRSQTAPSGFHVIFLPFADDFRNIEMPSDAPRASSEQVDVAKLFIKKLHFKYAPENFDNPDIQTHWRNVEALALDRSQLETVEDFTVPDHDRIDNKAGQLIANFKSVVFSDNYDPVEAVKKRPAPKADKGQGTTPKKAKPDASQLNVEEMAKDKKLDKLTVDQLKLWLQRKGVRVTGKKKAQLVQDVYEALGVDM